MRWFILFATRWSANQHVRTDPACRLAKLPKPGSRLDKYSRGTACRQCVPRLTAWQDEVLGIVLTNPGVKYSDHIEGRPRR